MEFPFTLPGQFAALTLALDEPGTDLQVILDVLIDDLIARIPSFLGLTVLIKVDGLPIAVSSMDLDMMSAAGSSLSVPMNSTNAGADASIVFYAYNPGAFVDLATDARRVLGLDGEVVLDGHIRDGPAGRPDVDVSGIRGAAIINRALGVLIARGHPPEQARAELDARATSNGQSPVEAAHQVLDSTHPGER